MGKVLSSITGKASLYDLAIRPENLISCFHMQHRLSPYQEESSVFRKASLLIFTPSGFLCFRSNLFYVPWQLSGLSR